MRRGFLDFSAFVIKLVMEILTALWMSVHAKTLALAEPHEAEQVVAILRNI